MKMKRFVRGPNLHDESESLTLQRNTTSVPPTTALSGEEAKQVYDEIINSASDSLQATSSRSSKSPSSSKSVTKTAKHKGKSFPISPPPPKKSLNQLMTLCESDLHSELQTYINFHASQSKSKFDINEQDLFGWSLLMSAACAGAVNCLQILLRNGASPSLKDKKGLTPMDLARKKGRKEVMSILEEWSHGIVLIELDDDETEPSQPAVPIFCEACNQSFTNQNAHLKSIAHLFSSGIFHNPDGKIHYGIPESNRGYQLMLKTGWDQSSGLGPDGTGHKFPIKTVLKRDRQGVGNEKDRKGARITHFAPFDVAAVAGWRNRNINRGEEPVASTQKKAEFKRRTVRERRKEIKLRRELS